MSYTPVLPSTGLTGYRFLQNTMQKQRAIMADSGAVARDLEYLRENLGKVKTVDDLMSDKRLLRVALGAFGLEDESYKTAFIRKALEGGTQDGSFVTRISDSRYKDFVKAFGFEIPGGPFTDRSWFVNKLADQFTEHRFEKAVGEQDQTMRLALDFKRRARDIATRFESEDAVWYGVLGDKPARAVLEKALGLPSGIEKVDVDRQVKEFKEAATKVLGTSDPAALYDPENVEKMITNFMVREQALNGVSAPQSNSPALALLQGAVSGFSAQNLFSALYGRS